MGLAAPFKNLGGKRKLVPALISRLPTDFSLKEYTFIEPFAGGAALALALLEKEPLLSKQIILNDYSVYIANLWVALQNGVNGLLNKYDNLIIANTDLSSQDLFNMVRDTFNTNRKVNVSIHSDAKGYTYESMLAVWFLFLNKNSFNGLVRFNKQGLFNAPLGKYPKLQIPNKQALLDLSAAIQGITIKNKDFEVLVKELASKKKIDNLFFYLDPPYVPLNSTSKFTEYTAGGFNIFDQYRLKGTIDYLTHRGAKVMLSNSSAELVYKLYKEYNVTEVEAARVINSKVTKRGKVKEYIVTNY